LEGKNRVFFILHFTSYHQINKIILEFKVVSKKSIFQIGFRKRFFSKNLKELWTKEKRRKPTDFKKQNRLRKAFFRKISDITLTPKEKPRALKLLVLIQILFFLFQKKTLVPKNFVWSSKQGFEERKGTRLTEFTACTCN
jgi:hypothetical protein